MTDRSKIQRFLPRPRQYNPAELVPLWQLAEDVAPRTGKTAESIWRDAMQAFWRGEFAPGGLTLLQSRSQSKEESNGRDCGAEAFGPFTRFELAQAALGMDFGRQTVEDAIANLLTWNQDDYRRVRVELRYYFENMPERGLCATRANIERWWSLAETPTRAAKARRTSKFTDANEVLRRLFPAAAELPHLMRDKRNRKVIDDIRKRGGTPPSERTIDRAWRAILLERVPRS